MKNMFFRKVLYVLSILVLGIAGATFFTLPLIVKWYSENIEIIKASGEVMAFLYITLVPFTIILFAVNRLSFSLLKDNCFNKKNLKQLKLITIS